MEIMAFMFSGFWRFIGSLMLLVVAIGCVRTVLEGLAHMIWGKQTVIHVTNNHSTEVKRDANAL